MEMKMTNEENTDWTTEDEMEFILETVKPKTDIDAINFLESYLRVADERVNWGKIHPGIIKEKVTKLIIETKKWMEGD
jgi:hypothetical protein